MFKCHVYSESLIHCRHINMFLVTDFYVTDFAHCKIRKDLHRL